MGLTIYCVEKIDDQIRERFDNKGILNNASLGVMPLPSPFQL